MDTADRLNEAASRMQEQASEGKDAVIGCKNNRIVGLMAFMDPSK